MLKIAAGNMGSIFKEHYMKHIMLLGNSRENTLFQKRIKNIVLVKQNILLFQKHNKVAVVQRSLTFCQTLKELDLPNNICLSVKHELTSAVQIHVEKLPKAYISRQRCLYFRQRCLYFRQRGLSFRKRALRIQTLPCKYISRNCQKPMFPTKEACTSAKEAQLSVTELYESRPCHVNASRDHPDRKIRP